MAKYYVNGYTTPDDVSNSDDVKRYQRMLGVKADGIWGRITQAAYEKYNRKNSSEKASVKSSSNDIFSDGFDWSDISDKIKSNLVEILRPAVENAINNRRQTANTNKAEIDADAAARGMENSTYVTSVKSKENASRDSDIAGYEANYNSTLASNLQSMLMEAYKTYSENRNAQRSYELEQRKLQQDQAQFEEEMAFQRRKLSSSGSSGRSASSKKSSYSSKGAGYGFEEYCMYIDSLGENGTKKLFSSNNKYWKNIRSQIQADIGNSGYALLYDRYCGNGSNKYNANASAKQTIQ